MFDCWYVARTRAKQEKAIKEKLDELGIVNFLPIRTEIRQWKDRKKKIDVVLIPNVIFIKTNKVTALSLPNDLGLRISYKQDYLTHQMMVVPEKQMDNFIFVWNIDNSAIIPDNNLMFLKGEKVRVIRGPFIGLEGELLETCGDKIVSIKLDQIFVGKLEISPNDIEKA